MRPSTAHSPQPQVTSRLLTRTEAAEYLRLKPQTLAAWACVRRYSLRFVRCGRAVRYRQSDLDAFLAERTVGAGT
jgi:excisionase family DNA binding protein